MAKLRSLNWSLGFGLEWIGLATARHPGIATMLLLASLVLSALALPRIGFDGNVVNVLDSKSEAFQDFVLQARSFHDFSGDLTVILENDELQTVPVFEGFRNLHLDLTLEEGIESVFSVFTLGDATAPSDGQALIPISFETDAEVRETLARLLRDQPSASAIISPARGAMVLLVRLEQEAYLSEGELTSRLDRLRATLTDYAPEGTKFSFSGMPQIRIAIVAAIIQDQTVLTAAGILLGCAVAWLIFGTIRAALICTLPAFISVTWILAIFSAGGTPLNFFTTALPTLALIIAFADTIVLYFRWQDLNTRVAGTPYANLERAIRTVGPASALTSVTTALAFASFAWADSHTMDELALFGVIAVAAAFLAVMIGLPLAIVAMLKVFGEDARPRPSRLSGSGGQLAALFLRMPVAVVVLSLLLVGLFSIAHFRLQPSYAISDYLPYKSEIRRSEQFADDAFGGTSQYYILLPVTGGGTFSDEENRERLIRLHDGVAEIFGKDRTLSLASAWRNASASQVSDVVNGLEDAPPSLSGRFVSSDRSFVQVSAATPAGKSTLKSVEQINQLEAMVERLGFADEARITGLTVLLSREFPQLIGQLRDGLIVSIFLAVGVIALATRNLLLAVASLVPNLVPILFTETVIYLSGASLSVTNVIALTIAFGIAIDNAVHVINAYERTIGESHAERVRQAVVSIAPALVASTGIICVAAIITQFSSMPSITELGFLLIGTLIVALLSNLAILPSMMMVILGLKGRGSKKTAGQIDE